MDEYIVLNSNKSFKIPFLQGILDHKKIDNDENLESLLKKFAPDKWKYTSDSDRLQAAIDYASYHVNKLGLRGQIRFRCKPMSDNDYGNYDPNIKGITINSYYMSNPDILINTIAHECKHAEQHVRAMNPKTKEDLEFKHNVENYITAEEDYQAYFNQILEKDARKYADVYSNTYKELMKSLGYRFSKDNKEGIRSKIEKAIKQARNTNNNHLSHKREREER